MQAPLTGKLRDETNDRLTPTHATNRGRRHRYYVSNRLISGGPDVTGWRLPAKQLEALVGTLVADHLSQAAREARLLAHPDLRANDGLAEAVRPLVEALQRGDSTLLADLIGGGTISPKTISITLDQEALAARLSVAADELAQGALQTKQSFSLRRRGVEAKLAGVGRWRRRWDSNPRYAFTHAGFQDRCIRPLCHSSGPGGLTRKGSILKDVSDAHRATVRTRKRLFR
jgi:site-specific DNA recombinase